MIEDPIVEEIHKIRQEHAAKFGFDVTSVAWMKRSLRSETQVSHPNSWIPAFGLHPGYHSKMMSYGSFPP